MLLVRKKSRFYLNERIENLESMHLEECKKLLIE